MECKDIEILVSDYLENNLSNKDKSEFEKHLNKCSRCEEFVNEFAEIKNELSELKREVSFFQKNRLYVIYDNNINEEEKSFGFLKWIGLIAATAIVLFNIFYFTNLIPLMNKQTHILVSKIERTALKTFSYIKMLTNPEDFAYMISKNDMNNNKKNKKKGGKNG